jgi:hypothetical protein
MFFPVDSKNCILLLIFGPFLSEVFKFVLWCSFVSFKKYLKTRISSFFSTPYENAKRNPGPRAELSICLYKCATSRVILHEKLAQQYKKSIQPITKVMGQHIKQSPTTQQIVPNNKRQQSGLFFKSDEICWCQPAEP